MTMEFGPVQRPRARLRAEDRRAQLIELGVTMLSTRTMDELSVDDISEAAGISRGLLFHYFDSKLDFQLAVVRSAADRLLAETEPDRTLAPAEQLDQSLRAYVRYVDENRTPYLTLVRGTSANPEIQAVFDRTRQILANRVRERWVILGITVTPEQDIAIRGWIAFVEEAVVRWVVEHENGVELEQLLDLLRGQLEHIQQRTPSRLVQT